MKLILFSTPICHLCAQAKNIINACLAHCFPNDDISLEVVDILNNADLLGRYGESIPVVREFSSEAELYWPFDSDDLEQWLAVLKQGPLPQ